MGYAANVAIAIAALFSPPQAQEPWSRDDVSEFVLGVSEAIESDDAFAPIPDVSHAVGRRFRLIYDASDGNEPGRGPDGITFAWTYDRSAQAITFWTAPTFVASREWIVEDPAFYDYARRIGAYATNFASVVGDGGVRSNAFGASARTKIVSSSVLGVMVVTGRGQLPPLPAHEGGDYTLTVLARPEEGRALSRNLQLVVEGTVAALPDGQVVKCAESYSGATISSPTTVIDQFCYANVEIGRIAFVDKRDGKVLREWPPAAE